MKKLAAWVLILALAACMAGCKGQEARNPLLPEGTVTGIGVTAFPEEHSRSFAGAEAEKLLRYLRGLELLETFEEDPGSYTGQTWVITLTYESGDEVTLYLFAELFLKAEDGPWYRISGKDGSRFEKFVK